MTRRPRGLASRINDLIAPWAPSLALEREAALVRRNVLQARASHYHAAGRTPRSKDFRANRSDAVESARWDGERLSWIARDQLRNNPRVVRIRRALTAQVVGAGIRPSVRLRGGDEDGARRARIEGLLRGHCLGLSWDADGLKTMLGQQALGFGAIVADGEVLFRRRFRRPADGHPLNFQVQLLEADYLDRTVDGQLRNGNVAVQGVEFDRIGRRVAYHLYTAHPGGRLGPPPVRRISAENVIHAFDPGRPGQVRGVSWFAPVLTLLHEMQKYQDGQVKRQEIAALFAGILRTDQSAESLESEIGTLSPGSILTIGDDEAMEFTDPPKVDGYEAFMRVTDRTIAAAMGMTYEALTGDYSNVNYTSGRMGRMDVDPMIRDWQQNLMVAQVCAGFGRWIKEAVEDVADIPAGSWDLHWTPPVRPVVDPTKDYKANETAMRSGQRSRRQVIRESGNDPEAVEAEIAEERAWEAENAIVLSSNAGAGVESGDVIVPPDDTPRRE